MAHSKRFFVYALLRSPICTQIFCLMKGVMRIHNRDKFHWSIICDCQVINFQNFSYQFSIHEMALSKVFLGRTSPKYGTTLLKVSPEVVLKQKKTVFKDSFEILHFYRNVRYSKFALLIQLWFLPFFSEDGRNRQK